MNKKLKIFAFAFIFSLVTFQYKVLAEASSLDTTTKVNIDTNKEWTVKFNSPLKAETVNSENIQVTDQNDKVVPATVSLGSNSTTIVISPKVSGYEPNQNYNLVISERLESTSGKKLSNPLKMKFTTVNKYSDSTSYESLPKVTSIKYDYAPLLSNQKQSFTLSTKNADNAQYKIFVHSYADGKEVYSELTNGYTDASNGKITSLKTLTAGLNGQKYKIIVYVKRANTTGAHKDVNTDYDNYYVDYFRCIDAVSENNNISAKYNSTLDELVNIQGNVTSTPVFVEASDMTNAASKNQIKYYMDPNNFMDDYGKYQFLKLTYTEGITADDLNSILQGKGILEGKGQAFLDAAKNNNINAAYLVSHALLETGNGQSILANGGLKDSSENYLYGAPVYNFFGIGAVDADANYYGTKTAYDNKWLSPEEAIEGGAKWISPRYINNVDTKQDTLYKMRWNLAQPGQHQYATDVSWAYKQIQRIKDIMSKIKNPALNFEIPQFK
ncbi:N-acetylglucosaminidase [Clostridium magnum]|uniref:Beta-N-acetylglucosaminidase n=1 Tax=Clostridium magnum DSM 2767 TaxID=1121326 RepID=A0A161WEA0_9CLOT|nr:glucosaminidase domain-containing protein [Clostridium magnum]KZL89995.1 beta-N-acetylglucosaminidase precursor [Clostridium magnum DSM 2767]SHI86733.1 Beta-N-acetylglucosaminidase [Clostridium magnum DSM 2767]